MIGKIQAKHMLRRFAHARPVEIKRIRKAENPVVNDFRNIKNKLDLTINNSDKIDAKLDELEKIKTSFDSLKTKITEYAELKQVENKTIGEISSKESLFARLQARLKLLEKQHSLMKKKGYSKTRMAKAKTKITSLKRKLKNL